MEGMKFCVTSSGCAFDNADVDEGYKKYTDGEP